jgi:diguanylate cyclase (GGDEF)-like protein/PAS domain S-box-containing protein
MTIRRFFHSTFIVSACLSAALGAVIIDALTSQRRLSAAADQGRRALALGNELMQSSEDLTRMARSYAVTLDPVYRLDYREILGIRNGEKPRPLAYSPAYWYLAGIGKGSPVARGQAAPLRELLRNAGITEAELMLLEEAQTYSDQLTATENRAMELAESRSAENRAAAVARLFDDAYATAQAAIMEPIQRFIDSVEARTRREMAELENRLRRAIRSALVLLALNLLTGAGMVFYSFRRVLAPLDLLHAQMTALAGGDFEARADIPYRNEIGALGDHYNAAAVALAMDAAQRRTALEALKASGEQTRRLLDSSGRAIFGLDPAGRCSFANPACVRLLGFAQSDDLVGSDLQSLIQPSRAEDGPSPAADIRFIEAAGRPEGVHVEEAVFLRADGSSFAAEYWAYPQSAGAGVSGVVVTFDDVTDRRRAIAAMASERRRLADILEGANAGTWEWEIQSDRLTVNARWCAILGYSPAELEPLTGAAALGLTHPDDRKATADLFADHLARSTRRFECERRMRAKNGGWVWVLDQGQLSGRLPDGRPLAMAGTTLDISQRKAAEERTLHLATHDALTGLPNRRLAEDRLAMAVNLARRHRSLAAVLFIDLDGFKEINDAFGHEGGDKALRETARRLSAATREIDTVARIGGDEFLVVAGDLEDRDGAVELARKLAAATAGSVLIGQKPVTVTASVGIALAPDDGESVAVLIQRADAAMYEVKRNGKNGFAFYAADPAGAATAAETGAGTGA